MTQPKYKEWEKIKEKQIEGSYVSQEKYCHKKKLPIFITKDGVCHLCGENYLENMTVEDASAEHITYCQLCAGSFVE